MRLIDACRASMSGAAITEASHLTRDDAPSGVTDEAPAARRGRQFRGGGPDGRQAKVEPSGPVSQVPLRILLSGVVMEHAVPVDLP